ncbi:hypothetical protein MMC30_003881 [Trapelia coarctata]|nr:hypothetical protein [Trapelia coarctata]
MPDPRLSTIAESSLIDLETTADAWHLPPDYFAVPASPTSPRTGSGTPPSPASPFPCHVSSPLAHSFAEDPSNNKKSTMTTGTAFKCDSPCLEGPACRFHNPEHPFHRRRKSSMLPSGVWKPFVDVKEIVAGEVERKAPHPPASLWTPPADPPSPTKPRLHPFFAINTGTTPSSSSFHTSQPTHPMFASAITDSPSQPPTGTVEPPSTATALTSAASFIPISVTDAANTATVELGNSPDTTPAAPTQAPDQAQAQAQPQPQNQNREKQRHAERAQAILVADPQGSELLYKEGWKLGERWLPLL